MTIKYQNVYIDSTYTIGGVYESAGPLDKYFDKIFDKDLYFGEKTFEKAESKLLSLAIEGLLNKTGNKEDHIDFVVSGDLQNQLASSDYALRDHNIPYLGVFSACSTISEAISIASSFLENGLAKKIIASTSSHNAVSEKQFRGPNEYGTLKPATATFTATGSAAILLTNTKTNIKVSSTTIGRVVDLGIKDANNMGAVMAPAAADTIYRHLQNTGTTPEDYDLILTGDLGHYGKSILTEYMKKNYQISLGKNYNDCGLILYDTKKQPVLDGASGPVTSALVMSTYVLNKLKTKKLNKVLLVPTGAIFSPTMVLEKESIPAISHAVELERMEL